MYKSCLFTDLLKSLNFWILQMEHLECRVKTLDQGLLLCKQCMYSKINSMKLKQIFQKPSLTSLAKTCG
ncbi:MAG: hypothetical protein DSY95_00435 [SAR324 cluster bacterium]|uniref:Uncharacterized protein n=1 Tax=SAR324 cluster bacterium TaxID=2024889 RepID=A0A432GZ85_9DELT|nr:MAG: hypothetical protein DSY95_00435 [SAR324 cluster bacterium]